METRDGGCAQARWGFLPRIIPQAMQATKHASGVVSGDRQNVSDWRVDGAGWQRTTLVVDEGFANEAGMPPIHEADWPKPHELSVVAMVQPHRPILIDGARSITATSSLVAGSADRIDAESSSATGPEGERQAAATASLCPGILLKRWQLGGDRLLEFSRPVPNRPMSATGGYRRSRPDTSTSSTTWTTCRSISETATRINSSRR